MLCSGASDYLPIAYVHAYYRYQEYSVYARCNPTGTCDTTEAPGGASFPYILAKVAYIISFKIQNNVWTLIAECGTRSNLRMVSIVRGRLPARSLPAVGQVGGHLKEHGSRS